MALNSDVILQLSKPKKTVKITFTKVVSTVLPKNNVINYNCYKNNNHCLSIPEQVPTLVEQPTREIQLLTKPFLVKHINIFHSLVWISVYQLV